MSDIYNDNDLDITDFNAPYFKDYMTRNEVHDVLNLY